MKKRLFKISNKMKLNSYTKPLKYYYKYDNFK